MKHQYQDLIRLFEDCFFARYQTRLIKGHEEPLYLPANDNQPYHALFFAHGFFSSALHEISHWLIAGEDRRTQVDFGYWYMPDGRTAEQQALFQQAEVKPQAMEWILSAAANYSFRVSIDNLNGSQADTDSFKHAIHENVKSRCGNGLPKRAEIFRNALCNFYGTPKNLNFQDFQLNTL